MSNKKQDPPRLCQVLGVQPDEQWRVDGDDSVYRVSSGGMLEFRTPGARGDAWRLSDVLHLTAVINQPALILRGPAWTDEERTMLRAFRKAGVHWLSRDVDSDVIDMWSERPEACDGGYKGTMIGSVPVALMPSMLDGQIVEVTSS